MILSNSVIMNSTGTSIVVHCSHEFVKTVFVITDFDCIFNIKWGMFFTTFKFWNIKVQNWRWFCQCSFKSTSYYDSKQIPIKNDELHLTKVSEISLLSFWRTSCSSRPTISTSRILTPKNPSNLTITLLSIITETALPLLVCAILIFIQVTPCYLVGEFIRGVALLSWHHSST